MLVNFIDRIEKMLAKKINGRIKLDPLVAGGILLVLFVVEMHAFDYLERCVPEPTSIVIDMLLFVPIGMLTFFASIWMIANKAKNRVITGRVHKIIILMVMLMGLTWLLGLVGMPALCA